MKTEDEYPAGSEKSRQRVDRIIKSLQHYINTYDKQIGYKDYSDSTIIEDMLYGLGIAFEPEKYKWNNGFELFKKEVLSKYIQGEKNGQ